MQLLISAPIRIDFNLTNSETVHKTDKFYELWTKLSDENYLPVNIDSISYYQNKNSLNSFNSYDNENKTKLDIIGLNILSSSKRILSQLPDESFIKKNFKEIFKSKLKLYDNTIAILDLKINLFDIEQEDNILFCEQCEKEVKKLITLIFKEMSTSIGEYLKYVKKNAGAILQAKNVNSEYDDYLDLHKSKKNLEIMWASCALKYEVNESNLALLDVWLKDAVSQEEISRIKSDSQAYSLEWLKYAFREDTPEVKGLWETMFLAQYYYSVIEVIVYNLKLIINESFTINKKKKFSFLTLFKRNKIITVNEKLEAISASAYIHITEYQDIKKYLKRDHLTVFNKVLNAWTFEDILENTHNLLSTAKGRVELIYNKIASKNNFYTDILLTSIGFFAIIDLVLSFSQYSREYTSDAMISSRGKDADSFLFTISDIPIDTFIGSGFFVSIMLLVAYFIYRKKILP